MLLKVGRNDPCPCGSGKKYKKCCMDKENNIVQFPGTGTDNFDEMIKEYELYCENAYNRGENILTFNQYFNGENEATSLLETVTQELNSGDFNSLEEMNMAAQNLMQQHNNEPMNDFLGLSPIDIKNIINDKFGGNQDIVELKDIKHEDISSTVIIKASKLFLKLLSDMGGNIPLTESRYINTKFCQFFINELMGYNINNFSIKELDFPIVSWVRHILLIGGYTKELKTRLKITEKGTELLRKRKLQDFYKELLMIAIDKFDWLYEYDGEVDFVQDSIIFSFRVLNILQNEKFSMYDFFEYIQQAFPFLEELEYIYFYKFKFLDEFCLFFGLLTPPTNVKTFEDTMYTTTKLFNKLFDWKA